LKSLALLLSGAFFWDLMSLPPPPANKLGCPIVDTNGLLTPLGYQQITSLTAATALTVPTGATLAIVYVEAQAVRYRDDGVAPTTTIGMPLISGAQFQYAGTLSAIQFIAESAGAILNISYYG
jgi:hypothetical protein